MKKEWNKDMVDDTLLNEVYEEGRERIYLSINIVNIPKIDKYKEELFALDEYLPNLLRSFIGLDYYRVLNNSDNLDKIMEQMGDTRFFTREEDVVEFINWVDEHPDFKELLNEDKVKELGDDLESLEKDYEKYLKVLKNG